MAHSLDDILEHLKRLRPTAERLEPLQAQRADWQTQVAEYAEGFLEALPDGPGYVPSEEMGAGLEDLPIGSGPHDMPELLKSLAENVDRPGINPASGAHMGYIPGGGLYPSSLADYMVAVTNRYAGVFFANPGAARMEHMLVKWMASIVGLPETAGGDLSSGGSIANLTAVVTAREAKKIRSADVPKAVVYLTQQVHHCVGKALIIAGLRESVIRRIPMDDSFRMRPDALRDQIQRDRAEGLNPFLLVASAGTTDTGAVDPLDRLAPIAKEEDLWFHVDGAYGAFFVLTDEAPDSLQGIREADSVVLDPHKSLFLPYGSGALLVRNRADLYNAHQLDANYMQDAVQAKEVPSPADHSPELTRHFRGLRLWLPLQLFGIEPFRASLSEKIWLTRYFYQKVQDLPHIEVGPEPDLSVMMFRLAPPEGDANAINEELIRSIQQDGRIFLSSTTVNDTVWLRLAVVVFRTHQDQVDLTLQILREKIGELGLA